MSENRELIWVPEKFAQQYKQITSDEAKYAALEKFIAGFKIDVKKEFESSLEVIEEDVVIFQGLMLKAKQSFTTAKNEALASSYALWEEYDKERPKVSAKIKELTDTVLPFLDQLDRVNNAMAKIQTYNIDRIMDVIHKFEGLSERGKLMFEFMMSNSDKI